MSEQEFLKYHRNNPNFKWNMRNRDGSFIECRVVYFPIRTNYDLSEIYVPAKALICIGENDFREVAYVYLYT